jgi:outer membrane usher protein
MSIVRFLFVLITAGVALTVAPAQAAGPATVVLPVRIDGVPRGEHLIRLDLVNPEDTTHSAVGQGLLEQLARLVNDAKLAELEAGEDGFVDFASLEAAGFTIAYDPQTVSVEILVPQTARRVQTIGGRGFEAQRIDEDVVQSWLAFAVNGSVGTSRIDQFEDDLEPQYRTAGRLTLNGRVGGFDGVNFLSDWFFNDNDGAFELLRGNTRLTWDSYEHAIRVQAGDLALSPIVPNETTSIAGLAVERRYGEIQPFRVTRPGVARQLSIAEPSTVRILSNGIEVSTLRLAPGEYSLSDLPIFAGVNAIDVEILGDSGVASVERFSVFSDATLLDPALTEFSLSIGVARRVNNAGTIEYGDSLVGSAAIRKGLTESLTLAAAAQARDGAWVADFDATFGRTFGTVRGELTYGAADGSGGLAGSVQMVTRPQFAEGVEGNLSVLVAANDENFRAFTVNPDLVPATGQSSALVAVNYGQQLFGTGVSGGLNYGMTGGEESGALTAALSRNIGRILIGVSAELPIGSERDPRIALSVTRALGPRHRVRARYDTRGERANIVFNRSQSAQLGSIGGSLEINRSPDDIQLSGSAGTSVNRADLRLSSTLIAGPDGEVDGQVTTVGASSAFVFAGGAFGVTRPVGEAFVVTRKHESLEAATIRIAASGGRTESQSGPLGPAISGRFGAYTPGSVQIVVDDLPSGYVLENTAFDVLPAPGSGYLLTIGSDRNYSVFGLLHTADSIALGSAGGEIELLDGDEPLKRLFFTNSAGRFFVSGLAPGKYKIRLFGETAEYTLVVGEDALLQDLGVLTPI